MSFEKEDLDIESDDVQKDEKDDSFLYAIAPKPTSEIEQIDINTTPAFQCLDEVSSFYL